MSTVSISMFGVSRGHLAALTRGGQSELNEVELTGMFKRPIRRESLFGPRQGLGGATFGGSQGRPRSGRRGRGGGTSILRVVLVLLLALLAGWAVKDRAGFYSALYEGKRAADRRDYPTAQQAFERAWQLNPRHPLVLDCAGYLFIDCL